MTDRAAGVALTFLEEVVNNGRLELVDGLFTADHVVHDPLFDDLPDGPRCMALRSERYRDAFPDLRLRVDEVAVTGPVVVARGVAGGTHRGPLLEHEPTGQAVMALVFYWFRFEGGLIAETWMTSSAQRSIRQLGLLPVPGHQVRIHGGA